MQLIKTSRNPAFEMVEVSQCVINDYEKLFAIDEKDLPKNVIKISKAVKIVYFPNGQVNLHYDYDGGKVTTVKLANSIYVDVSSVTLAEKVGISKDKEKDLKHLLQFCTNEGQQFGESFLNATFIKSEKNVKKEKLDVELPKKIKVAKVKM